MPRYTYSDEKLQAKIAKMRGETEEQQEKYELRKRRELLRRKLSAKFFTPQICMGDPGTGDACTRYATPGAVLCDQHGGTTKAMQYAAKMRLLCLVEPALRVVQKALSAGDLNLALKAAQICLDRAGFHPHATLEVQENPQDLSNMTDLEIKNRAQRLLKAMENQIVVDPADYFIENDDNKETSVH